MLAMVRSTKTKLALPKTNIYIYISLFMSQNSLSKVNVNQLFSNSLTLPFYLKNSTSRQELGHELHNDIMAVTYHQ